MHMKKVLAVVMSFCMVVGTVSYGAPVITQGITAQAADVAVEADCYSFDEETGELTLSGKVDGDVLRKFSFNFRQTIKSVTAEAGTVLSEDSSSLFNNYRNCTSIDLLNVDTSNVTNMSSMFDYCPVLTSLEISCFDTSNVTNMSKMFANCSSLTSFDLSGFDTSKVTDMSEMFANCLSLTSFDLSGFDTSKVTDMSEMFRSCGRLKTLDLSGFDTSKVADMDYMFNGCNNLTSLDLSGFNTGNVTRMYRMFEYCFALKKLDLSSFDTSKVKDMGYLFANCTSLKELDLSGFDTSSAEYIEGMFSYCSSLSKLDLSGFNTSKVIEMYTMFFECKSLTSLDLSSFDTRNISSMTAVFRNCNSLKTLILGENFVELTAGADLPNKYGWVNVKAPTTVVSGIGESAFIKNEGKNTYKRFDVIVADNSLKYPKNIKVTYSEQYHQIRLTWDKVQGADRYGIAVYLAGKWRIQAQNITETTYTSPKNLTPGVTYKIAVVARVYGNWYTANASKNAVTVIIK